MRYVLLLCLLLASCAIPSAERVLRADLCVYGATSAGVVAAVQAARQGNSVVLLEPSGHLGGLSSSGLGATDIGNKAAVGGMAREFYRRIRTHYAKPEAWVHELPDEFEGRGHRRGEDAAWTFEPHVARATFATMLEEAGVAVHFHQRLDRRSGLQLDGGRILELRAETGLTVRARYYVDATYEGDLMACAGVEHTVGREANSRYDETLNGVQVRMATYHQFNVPVDPYSVPGDPDSGLLPGIGDGPGEEGKGDRRVQAYCFRICATDVEANRIPWPRPADYDEARYELLFRNFEAGDRRIPWHPVWMPNRKTDSNNNHAVSTDHIGFNYDYPVASYAEREAIVAEHLSYTQGLLWSLANHPRVPEEVREHFSRFGLCKDEFVDSAHWPPMLYVREARRMVADVVMTERHCRGLITVDDPVGLGAYGMDSHNVQRYVSAEGTVRNEGDVQVHGFSPYPVSYRSIVPARGQCRNLLVPVCLSASHIAYGSIRMEPVFMVLGQSAAIAAGMALEGGLAVQDVPYPELRERLLAAAQVLEWRGEIKVLPIR